MKIIRFLIAGIMFLSLIVNPVYVGANSFEDAKTVKTKAKFSFYAYDSGERDNYYKIKVKKKGKYTITINSKNSLNLIFYSKNGSEKNVKMVKRKITQGYVSKEGKGTFILDESQVTDKFKGKITFLLKKGTYILDFYSCNVDKVKVKVKTTFKKSK